MQLEKTIKENTIKNKNIIKNLNYNNSCSNLCSLNNENSLIKLDSSNNGNYNYGIKNLKNIYNFNNNNKKIFNFYSPKFDINPLEQHKNQNPNNNKTISGINSNIFNSTYNKIINGLAVIAEGYEIRCFTAGPFHWIDHPVIIGQNILKKCKIHID